MALASARQLAIARSRSRPSIRREVTPPDDQPPTAIERELASILGAAGSRMAGAARDAVPGLIDWLRRERVALGMRADAAPPPAMLVDAMERAAGMNQLEDAARRIGAATSEHQRRQLSRQLQAVIGTNISTRDARLGRLIDGFAGENAQHIRGIAADTSAKMARIIAAGVATSKRPEAIAAELDAAVDLVPGRALRIARDQVGKLYGQVAKQRQRDLGVEEYDWITVRDQRVRGNPGGKYPDADPSHFARHGKRFSWDDPPEDGHPGEAVNCRCTARPVLSKLLAVEGEEAPSEQIYAAPREVEPEEAPRPVQVQVPREVLVPAPPPRPVPIEPTFKMPAPPAKQAPDEERTWHERAVASIPRGRVGWADRLTDEWAEVPEGDPPKPITVEEYLAKRTTEVAPGMTQSARAFAEAREAFAASLTQEQADAALYYSFQGDKVLNNAMRSKSIVDPHADKIREMAAKLDETIAAHQVPEDIYVARGMGGDFAIQFAKAIKVGDVFQEPGYTSTAATSPFPGDVVLRIKIPKGSSAAPIPTFFENEDEYLLPRGSKFRVLATKHEGGRYELELELVF